MRVLLLGLLVMPGCAAPLALATRGPTQSEWQTARDRLAALRSTEPRAPYVEVVRVSMQERRSGRTLAARGAVAVDPHHAMRMVLLGPGGATALDAWATEERYRVSIPAIDLLHTGGRHVPDSEPLPIGFFRWWFLAPLEGRLLAARATPSLSVFVLRRSDATVTLQDTLQNGTHSWSASRREGQAVDQLSWSGERAGESRVPHEGDRTHYEQPRTGISVDVVVESVSDDPPSADAFVDPGSR